MATSLLLPATVVPVPALVAPAAAGFTRDEVKARAKAMKKWRKHKLRRYFISWCACLHALGFSF